MRLKLIAIKIEGKFYIQTKRVVNYHIRLFECYEATEISSTIENFKKKFIK